MKTRLLRLCVATWFVLASNAVIAGTLDDAKMAGRWSGVAEIVVAWTSQRTLAVDLTITRDGFVSGAIGDAKLRHGRIEPNRDAIGRVLHWKTDYLIVGELSGDIIHAEGICREAVKLPLNWADGKFAGGLHTSGSLFGGKERMILSATHLKLRSCPAGSR